MNDNTTGSWQPVPGVVTRSRQAVMATYFGLMGLFTGDALVSMLSGAPLAVAIFLWLFRILPLIIFLPGIRRGDLRTHAWLSFVVLLFFVHAVVTAFLPDELLYGVIYALLCTALFTAIVVYIRVARRHLGGSIHR
jgi:uncharacterized membrane protein